ncbi:MAG TPA: hypothetical protein VHA77_12230 [Xanthobacteraceae bacterium]|nr:hypothetical protein [Xanthobacteraceae bacterium]
MVLNLTPRELREWASRCEAEAQKPVNAGRREQLLKMRDALLGLAETESHFDSPSEREPPAIDGHNLGPLRSPDSGPSPEQCEAFANQCRKLAETAGSESYRKALLDMARKWDELSLTRKP